jgi:hypothetical protein
MTDLQLFLDWQWMDGRRCFKGQTGHWHRLAAWGWLAAATLLLPMGPWLQVPTTHSRRISKC